VAAEQSLHRRERSLDGLHALDGVDLLYSGSRRVTQTGHALDLRVGALKEWPGARGARSLEAIVVHNDFETTHDVLFADVFWDPSRQTFLEQARVDTNYDHTTTWGAQLQYEMPLAAPGWRIGWLATVNRSSHPKIPNYEIASVAVIPRDPGLSHAYNFGIGVSKVLDRRGSAWMRFMSRFAATRGRMRPSRSSR
jgi:hypothetical protein